MEKARSQCFNGVLPLMNPASAEPHQNMATVVICISISFQNAIEEIYNKDASLSIRLKRKKKFLCVACNAIERDNSGIFRCDVVLDIAVMFLRFSLRIRQDKQGSLPKTSLVLSYCME
jgi:hypothetical protein